MVPVLPSTYSLFFITSGKESRTLAVAQPQLWHTTAFDHPVGKVVYMYISHDNIHEINTWKGPIQTQCEYSYTCIYFVKGGGGCTLHGQNERSLGDSL